MSEKLEREQQNLRVDPSLRLIMKGFKKIRGVSSIDDVYELAVREFIANHPEEATQVMTELSGDKDIIDFAISNLVELLPPATE